MNKIFLFMVLGGVIGYLITKTALGFFLGVAIGAYLSYKI